MDHKDRQEEGMRFESSQEMDKLDDEGLAIKTRSKDGQLPFSIIIPAYNEAKSIVSQVKALKDVMNLHGYEYEVIVVDDGSEDGTGEKAVSTGVRVLHHPENRGYGAALKTGINAARNDTIVIIDADGTYPAEVIPELMAIAREFDMVVGARIGENVHIPFRRKPAKWFLRKLAGYLAGRPIPDLNSGLRVMNKTVVEKFSSILPSGFSFTTTITLAYITNDYTIHYFPIEYNPRIGQSKIRPVDAYYFLLLILRTIVYFNPLKVFLPLGATLFVMGLAKFIYDLFLKNLSESAIFGFLGAFIIWAIGLLSDQISKFGPGRS